MSDTILKIVKLEKICIKCNVSKLINEFPARKNSRDEHRNDCTECYKELKKLNGSKLYQKNKEKHKQWHSEYMSDPKKYSNKRAYDRQYAKSERGRDLTYKRKYGISLNDVKNMLARLFPS